MSNKANSSPAAAYGSPALMTLARLATSLIPAKGLRKAARRRLINSIQAKWLEGFIPTLRKEQSALAKALGERMRRGEKARVLFTVMDGAMFAAESLYDAMNASPHFAAELVVVPDTSRGDEFRRHRQQIALDSIRSRHPEARAACGDDLASAECFDGKVDILVTSIPYSDQTLEQYSVRHFCHDALTVIVPYFYAGYEAVELRRMVFRPDFAFFWKLVLPSERSRELWTGANPLLAENSVACGYPKMDRLAEEMRRASAAGRRDRRKVLVSPHHSIAATSDGAAQSNFLRLADFYLQLAKDFPQIDFIFRPHPLLFQRFRSHPSDGWDAKRVDDYIAAWEALPNGEYQDGGDYMKTFAEADALVHDCGSFCAEWFYTAKPQCFVLREDSDPKRVFNPFGMELLANMHATESEDGIRKFIEDAVLNGRDGKAAARAEFAKEKVCVNHPKAGEAVLRLIEDELLLER